MDVFIESDTPFSKFGGRGGTEMETGHTLICDNTCFSNDVQSRYWDNGDLNVPPAKSDGRTVMTSDFIDPIGGFMQYDDSIWSNLKVMFNLNLIKREYAL